MTATAPTTARLAPSPRLHVQPWSPRQEEAGFPLRSPYVEQFCTSFLGPTGVLLLRRFGLGFLAHPEGFVLDTEVLHAQLGLGKRRGSNSPLWRAVVRLSTFGLVMPLGADAVAVRQLVPPLTRGLVARLPDPLRDEYEAVVAGVSGRP